MTTRTAIYPGTFDPITLGHQDVIKRALGIADKLIIAIADDIPKTPVFSLSERENMVREDVANMTDNKRIEVTSFSGLLMNFAAENKATIVVRGLRAVSDFEYEFQLAAMNTKLNPNVQTVFLPASENTQFIASNLIKEIARLGGDVTPFVSTNVAGRLKEFYSE